MIEQVREYFRVNYSYVNLDELTDVFIRKYLEQSYLERLSFEMKMNCLYDYILSNDLVEVVE
jgi:hypothetical protein